jgi:hypothetical protein
LVEKNVKPKFCPVGTICWLFNKFVKFIISKNSQFWLLAPIEAVSLLAGVQPARYSGKREQYWLKKDRFSAPNYSSNFEMQSNEIALPLASK